MSLQFPNNANDGDSWEDDCGATWVYNEANNSWAKPVDLSVTGVSPFVRDPINDKIVPRIKTDDLDMEDGSYLIESLEPLQ
jgi:hypothetical protein